MKQLEKSNPKATVEDQKAFVNAAVSRSLKAKIASAVKAGGKEAIKEILHNSYVNVGMAILDDWKKEAD